MNKRETSKNCEAISLTLLAVVVTAIVVIACFFGFGEMNCAYGKYSFDHTCQYCNEALGELCSDCVDSGRCTDCIAGFFPNSTSTNGTCIACNETLGELCVDC